MNRIAWIQILHDWGTGGAVAVHWTDGWTTFRDVEWR